MASSSSSSSSSFRQLELKKHQVFLSFRGEDTRHNFTSHLLEALKDKGLNVFFDEEILQKGEEISQALLKGIAASNISIIVLSVDYASSKSCLAELSEIMDCKCTQGQIVLPIFYHVNPSDVRNIGGRFKTSFDGHESKRPDNDEVQRWKKSFAKVGKLKGWHIEGGIFDRSETEYIKCIVEDAIKKLNSKPGTSYGGFIGIDDQKEKILKLMEQEDIRVIGLWGKGGIGKTTLADAVYKEVSPKFDGHDFVQNVRNKLEKQGRESLRNELLSELLNQKDFRVNTLLIESTVIQDRLNNKRVFVVLDDVNEPDLIDYLGVKHFHHESKILVASRDRQILKNGGADKIYKVKELNEDDSLQLFSKFAFKQLKPVADFLDLSIKFVKYAQGYPLALKVLGSNLHQRPKNMWESALDKLKEYSEPDILKVLKISFDGLDELEKNIFLDIACFFNRADICFVEAILNDCYNGAKYGIENLIDKCLLDIITIHMLRGISLHDLIEEMSWNIVQNACSNNPGEWSRLWRSDDVHRVFKYNMGTKSIEGIMLDISQIDVLQSYPTVFENMFNLRFLKFYSSRSVDPEKGYTKFQFEKPLASLPDELRYLEWAYYPFKSLPSNFNPKNLGRLNLWNGNIKQLWNERDQKDLTNLKEINFSYCKNLRKISHIARATKLESIYCCCCKSLIELPSLQDHLYLKQINLAGCESLVELPCLSHMTSLHLLELGRCHKLRKFPEIPDNFLQLNLKNTEIEEVPDSIEHLLKLKELRMGNSRVKYISSNISKLKSLSLLDLSYCPIAKFPEIPSLISSLYLSGTRIEEVRSSIECLNELLRLDMSGSNIQNLRCNIDLPGCPNFTKLKSEEIPTEDVPSSISRFKNLRELKVNNCKRLKLLSELPPRLQYLDARDCTPLEKVSFTDQCKYQLNACIDHDTIIFSNCFNLNQDSMDNIVANAMLRIGYLAKQSAGKNSAGPKKVFCCLPGTKISAKKFEDQSMGSSLILKIGPNKCSGSRFLAFALCIVVDLRHRHNYEAIDFICEYQLKATGGDCEKFQSECWAEPYFKSKPNYLDDHVLILFSDKMVQKDQDYEKASFVFKTTDKYRQHKGTVVDDIKVEKCGVHVFYVDAESSAVIDVESSAKFNPDEMGNDESVEDSDIYFQCEENFDSEEDANIEKVHDDSAT